MSWNSLGRCKCLQTNLTTLLALLLLLLLFLLTLLLLTGCLIVDGITPLAIIRTVVFRIVRDISVRIVSTDSSRNVVPSISRNGRSEVEFHRMVHRHVKLGVRACKSRLSTNRLTLPRVIVEPVCAVATSSRGEFFAVVSASAMTPRRWQGIEICLVDDIEKTNSLIVIGLVTEDASERQDANSLNERRRKVPQTEVVRDLAHDKRGSLGGMLGEQNDPPVGRRIEELTCLISYDERQFGVAISWNFDARPAIRNCQKNFVAVVMRQGVLVLNVPR